MIFVLLPKLDQGPPWPKHEGKSMYVGACVTASILRFLLPSLLSLYMDDIIVFKSVFLFFSLFLLLPLSSRYLACFLSASVDVKPHSLAGVLDSFSSDLAFCLVIVK